MYAPQSSTQAIYTTQTDPNGYVYQSHHSQFVEPTDNQQFGHVYYQEEQFDGDVEWQQHPWQINDEEEEMFTQYGQQRQMHQRPRVPNQNYHERRRPPQPQQRQYNIHQRQEPPQQYNTHMQQQHRIVARGPKLHFPEFNGDDSDGGIRKAEKYFEMVGVPPEDKVKIAVMYINGKAEIWWRGTGCNENFLPWHQFCKMVSDRFYTSSEYEVIGQFHNLKQLGTVVDYVGRFEELVSMVKRTNPTLSETYYIRSFISGLKDHIQYPLQCHQPATLTLSYWYAKRLEQANPSYKKFSALPNQSKLQKPWQKDKEKEKETNNQTIAELRAAGKCFKCREPWVPGHTKVCKGKQLLAVILVENAEGQEEVAVVEDGNSSEEAEFHDAQQMATLQISMHALCGTPSQASTFTLR